MDYDNEMNLAISSPDRAFVAHLKRMGEIRFGPTYYSLVIEGREIGPWAFGRRIFGDTCMWSRDSNFFAIEEWDTLDYQKGPETLVLLLDIRHQREAVLERIHHGFFKPTSFQDGRIIYKREYFSTGKTDEAIVEIRSIKNWK